MRRGFTILELLVASLLLSILVTILTMVFNQSSIAWRTGVAGVSELGKTREQFGTIHDIEDDALPGLGMSGVSADNRDIEFRTVSIFKNWSGGSGTPVPTTTGRLCENIKWQNAPRWTVTDSAVCKGEKRNMSSASSAGGDAFIVGVRSAGPDRNFNTADDVDTFPKEAD